MFWFMRFGITSRYYITPTQDMYILERTMTMIMICLNIRIGRGFDWKTLRRNPIQQAILQGSPQAKWKMMVSIVMLYCFLVTICHSAAWIRMFNFMMSFHFLKTYCICIRQGMKTVGISGKICLLLWHCLKNIPNNRYASASMQYQNATTCYKGRICFPHLQTNSPLR